VLTTTAHDSLRHVHDRSPVIIPPEMFYDWLNPATTDKTAVQEILDAIPEPVLMPRVFTNRVNSVRNSGPELLQPASNPMVTTATPFRPAGGDVLRHEPGRDGYVLACARLE
jgi:putative SOS response-associated peptidase YedK